MGPGSIPLGLVDIEKKTEEGAIAKGKAETKAYVDDINRQAAESKKFYDETIERLKKMGPLPGLPKIPISNELPSTAAPVIQPDENDPKRDYAPLGKSPVLTQRDIQGDPLPGNVSAVGVGGPEDPGGPPIPVRESQKPAGEQKPPAAPTPVPPRRDAYKGTQYAPPTDWQPAQDKSDIGEMLAASWTNVLFNANLNSDEVALDAAYDAFISKGKALGLNAPENPVGLYRAMQFNNTWPYTLEEMRAKWHEAVNKQLEANPELRGKLGAVTREALGGMADQLSRDAYQHYAELKEARGEGFWSIDTLAEFGVGMGASLTDPFQAATAPIGGPSKTILSAAMKGAAINAAIDLAMEPAIQSRQLRLGNINSWEEGVANAAMNVGISGALGFTLSGGEKALEKVFTRKGAKVRPEAQAEFDHAREALTALAADTRPQDPETSALVRKALAEAERDFSTAQQADDRLAPSEFLRAVEDADAQLRGLQEFLERPQVLPDRPERAIDTTDDGPTPKVGETLTEDGKPVTFTQFNPRELGVAPDEFQYKRFSGEEGVNGAIADVGQWHAPSSGKILVFERANGERIVADGHQRRSKALSLMGEGQDGIRLDGYLYREVDGWTPADLRLKGAQKNIREGRSDVLDTAQALRERPDAIDSSFPLSRSNIRQARQLARLAPEAWDLTRAGVLDPHYAALIGQVAPDRPGIHAPLARTLIEAAPDNIRQAENIISEALLDYAERDVSSQPMLFGDDNLGRGVMYKERAQIMDAAYAWLRSERSVFKALVEKGDIARALGNELVDAANLTAKDQVEMAIAAVMHSRRAGVRTAVSDMVTRALDSVRREGVSPTRAGQQVAREIRTLVEERGFRALLEAEGPPPPQVSEAGPLFDGPGTPAHVAQADMLEGDLRPEGVEPPKVDLAKIAKPQDEVAGLVDELKGAGDGGGDRTPDQILNDIKKLLEPKKEGEGKTATPTEQADAEFQKLQQTEKALRDALFGLTDEQKISLVRMQYPDAYAMLNRLTGAELDDAIVGRVMAGEIKYAKRGAPDGEITYKPFYNDAINPKYNKIIEMALNGIPNLEIAIEIGTSVSNIKAMMSRAKKQLARAGVVVNIEPGQTGKSVDGFAPGEMKAAVIELAEQGLNRSQIFERLIARGFKTTPSSVFQTYFRWSNAKRKGVKYAIGLLSASEAARMQRAREQGFDVDTPLYHGTMKDFDEFTIGDGWDGIWLTPSPYEAGLYAGAQGMEMAGFYGGDIGGDGRHPNIMPVFARLKNPLVVTKQTSPYTMARLTMNPLQLKGNEWAQKLSYYGWPDWMAAAISTNRGPQYFIDRAKRRGHDGIIFKNMIDSAGMFGEVGVSEQILVFDPKNIRGKFAAFDPAQSNSSKLLASVGEGANPRGASPDELFDRLTAEFGDGASALTRIGEVNIVDTAPAWADARAWGLTDSRGRVTIVASNVSPDMMRGLVLHEVGVHVGLPAILGHRGFEQLLGQVQARIDAGDAAFLAAAKRIPADTDPRYRTEETLAYLVQFAPKTPWLQQVFADIRAWLYRTFPAVRDWMTLTDADLQSLAVGAVRHRIRAANATVSYGTTRSGAVVSTAEVKYARRGSGSENPSNSSGSEVSGGARQPGRAVARPDAGAVAGAAERGALGAEPQPSRAVVTEPLPQAPRAAGRGRWNDRIELNAEQRAERRAQFADFVDKAEFDIEMSRGNGDFRFRNGKRTGERGAYEQLVYTLRQVGDVHETWLEAMDPESTRLEVEIHGSEATIPYSRVADEFRSTGLGQKLYMKAIDDLLARGIVANSDVSMSDGAIAMWKSLRKQGYDVTQRVPDSLLERGHDNQLSASDDSTAIFFIARKKPAKPDLPVSNRDLSNAIDEQRSLTEHMPVCLAGKRRA